MQPSTQIPQSLANNGPPAHAIAPQSNGIQDFGKYVPRTPTEWKEWRGALKKNAPNKSKQVAFYYTPVIFKSALDLMPPEIKDLYFLDLSRKKKESMFAKYRPPIDFFDLALISIIPSLILALVLYAVQCHIALILAVPLIVSVVIITVGSHLIKANIRKYAKGWEENQKRRYKNIKKCGQEYSQNIFKLILDTIEESKVTDSLLSLVYSLITTEGGHDYYEGQGKTLYEATCKALHEAAYGPIKKHAKTSSGNHDVIPEEQKFYIAKLMIRGMDKLIPDRPDKQVPPSQNFQYYNYKEDILKTAKHEYSQYQLKQKKPDKKNPPSQPKETEMQKLDGGQASAYSVRSR